MIITPAEGTGRMSASRYGRLCCPDCGQNNLFLITAEGRELDDKGKLYWYVTFIKCEKCNWDGTNHDLLEDWEFKSKKRTELIDRILK
jgi:hypothetical protein